MTDMFEDLVREIAEISQDKAMYGFWGYYVKGEYAAAQDFLKKLYRNESLEKNYVYYLLLAVGRASEARRDKNLVMMNEAVSNLRRAKLSANDDEYKYVELAKKGINQCRIEIEQANLKKAEEYRIQASECEYADQVAACLEYGELTDRERHLLERLRVAFGISEERANEIEASFTPDVLTLEEMEYAEQLRYCLKYGVKPNNLERGILESLAKALGIDSMRASHIERRVLYGK